MSSKSTRMRRGVVAIIAVAAMSFLSAYRINSTGLASYRIDSTGLASQLYISDEAAASIKLPNITEPALDEKPTTVKSTKQPLKKFLAIHIGPSKTGTSTIQNDLYLNVFGENTLEEDKIIYVGKYGSTPNPNRNRKHRIIDGVGVSSTNEERKFSRANDCMFNILKVNILKKHENGNNSSDVSVLEKASLRQEFIDKCWANIDSNGLNIDQSYMLNYSLVDSHEEHSYHNSVNSRNQKKRGMIFRCYEILGYERLIVVGAYRRYAEWMVSAYTESIKARCINPKTIYKTKDEVCGDLEQFMKDNEDPFSYRARFYKNIDITLPEILAAGPSNLEVKVLNYFQLPHYTNYSNEEESNGGGGGGVKAFNSITTELYCDVFGAELAPHTCNLAIDIAKREREQPVEGAGQIVNKGTTSNSVYQNIVATGYRMGYIFLTNGEVEQRKQKCKRFWCEALRRCQKEENICLKGAAELREQLDKVTSGGKTSIVGTNTSNITIWKDLADHHTKVHKKIWIKSLPMICPPRHQLEKLLNKSLEFEKKVMPEFYATPLGEKEHKRVFWDVWDKEKRLFCWEDIDRLFQGATSWDEVINERMVSHDWGNFTESTRIFSDE